MFCSFQSTVFKLLLLNLFQSILLFRGCCKWNYFLNFIFVYRNTIDFCILIFYPVTLPNLFISSNCFFSGFLRINLQIEMVLLLSFVKKKQPAQNGVTCAKPH